MGLINCPGWDYKRHPNIAILHQCVATQLIPLRKGKLDGLSVAKDTRSIHHAIFRKLTPTQCPYYAGNYRGSRYCCLLTYEVVFNGKNGTPAHQVADVMNNFAETITTVIETLDKVHIEPYAFSVEDRMKFAVRLACEVFIVFTKIHPYADGNGHLARFLIWTLLGRYNYWPIRWGIEPRPVTQPDYHILINEYETGNVAPLVGFVYSCIDP